MASETNLKPTDLKAIDDPWERIAAAQKRLRDFEDEDFLESFESLDGPDASSSDLIGSSPKYAFRTLIRLRTESILRRAAGLTCRSKYASRNAATYCRSVSGRLRAG